MSTTIHPLACVHPNAKIGDNVEIGPYAYVDEFVEIGDGCKILPHATIFNYVKMGKNCSIFPGAVVGAIPQDLKFDGGKMGCLIADGLIAIPADEALLGRVSDRLRRIDGRTFLIFERKL